MTRKELPARAANILRGVASTTACSPATVESLRSFLAPSGTPPQQQKKPSAKTAQSPRKPPTAPPVKAVGARARKQPAVAVLEVTEEGQDAILAQERLALATEVANVTLRSLTEAIKRPPAQKKRTPLARSSSNASFSNGRNSRSQTPLQPICANRITDSPSKPCHSRRSSSTASVKDALEGLRAQAECARIAYATLRSMQGKELQMLPYLQLETGMSALITKLIVLGFDDLAVKELRILRRHLENSGEPSARKPVISGGPISESENLDARAETLPGMLKFRNIDVSGALLALIIASQLHVLKIIASRRDASAVESCLQHLGLHVSYSPANLIQRQINPDAPESQARAARQLESLTQVLLALCPLRSSTDDNKIGSSGNGPLPEAAFQIQLLALRIRYTWWELSGHQSNVSREMVSPFSRYLAIFRRKSRLGRREKYELAQSAFESISKCVQNITGFREEMFFDIYQSLADLAQDALEHSEAVRWISRSRQNATQYGASRAQLCTLACRLATLQLRSADCNSDDVILMSLQEAAGNLTSDLQGESAELDELLVAVACIRKSAFSVVQDSLRVSSTELSAIAEECRNIVLLCLQFMVRYVGNGSAPDENDKVLARRKQRERSADQVAAPAVESVVAMARFAAGAPPETWDRLEAGLRDCSKLVTRLEDGEEEARPDQIVNKRSSSCFVLISNAYWYRFLRLRQEAIDVKNLRESLRNSIDLIRGRPMNEKIEGFLTMKLERYGQIYENLRDYKKAADAYQEALATQIESGRLQAATEAAVNRSLPQVFESGGEFDLLSRMLLAYPSVALKAAASGEHLDPFYDPERLCDSERGVLLEQQLIAVVSFLLDRGPSTVVCNALHDLAENLLSLYTSKAFPVRRLRVVVRLLGLLLANPGVLRNDLQEQVLKESHNETKGGHYDINLLQLLPHLSTSRIVLVTLYGETSDVEKLENVLVSWSRMVQEHPDLSSLQTQVYDLEDWLVQLEFLAQYLDMQGLDLLRVPVLQLLVTIHEATTSMQCSAIVSRLSALGTQYSRLGYSGRAGLFFHKAQKYVESSDIADPTTIRWQLSHAEYALVNRNISVW